MISFSSVAIVATVVGMLSGTATTTEALTIVAPSEGMTVVAARPYAVEWAGADADTRFDIDLHYCGSYSFCMDEEEDCGFHLANLCMVGDIGCIQGDGGYDVVMPEPIAGTSGNGYRVRIAQVGSETHRCSEDFYLMASADAAMPGEAGGPSMVVVEPTADTMAVAGEIYTVEFDYDNGFGERAGRFKIDLYKANGPGDCGTWVTSVCEKPYVGCHDTQGDYDIIIPEAAQAGQYKIRVGLFGDDSVFACSRSFEIVTAGERLWLDDDFSAT